MQNIIVSRNQCIVSLLKPYFCSSLVTLFDKYMDIGVNLLQLPMKLHKESHKNVKGVQFFTTNSKSPINQWFFADFRPELACYQTALRRGLKQLRK